MSRFAREIGKWRLALGLALVISAGWAEGQVRRVSESPSETAEIKQSRQDLERERKRLEADVALTAKLIASTQTSQQRSVGELRLLERQIRLRREILKTNEAEIEAIETEIDDLEGLAEAMHGDVDSLLKSYAQLAVLSYRSRNDYSALLWLLAAEDFAQAYDRLMYLRELRRYRTLQIGLVRRAQSRLDDQLTQLEQRRNQKQDLLIARKAEKQRLDLNRAQKATMLTQLKTKEGEYQKQLAAYRNRLSAVQRDIERLIKDEIERAARAEAQARARAARGGRANPTDAATLAERDNLKRLGGLFEKNQGKLPWPIAPSRAVVTSPFGVNEDPSGAKVQNDGIFLSSDSEQQIRSVFNGKVTHVRTNRVIGTVVIIQHGQYRSVYVNLSQVLVKEGDEVSTLQPIGTFAPGDRAGGSELQFLIYNGRTPVDPQRWIASRN